MTNKLISLYPHAKLIGASFLILGVLYPIWYGFALLIPDIGRTTSWSRGTISGVLAVLLVTHATASMFAGKICELVGVKAAVRIGSVFVGLGMLLSSRAQLPVQMYAGYGLLGGLGISIGGWVPIVSAIRQNVDRKSVGIATGIAATGIGLGLLIATPLLQWMMKNWGWRLAILAEGLTIFLLMQLVVSFLPNRLDRSGDRSQRGNARTFHMISLRQFWLLIVTFFSFSFAFQLVQAHQVAFLSAAQWSPVTASSVVGIVAALSLPGKPILGALADRYGGHRVYSFGAVCLIGAIAILLELGSATPWRPGLYLYTVLFSIAYCIIAPVYAAIATYHFGRLTNYASAFGALMTGSGLGSATGVYAGGVIFDVTGNYVSAFVIAGLAAALSILVIKLLILRNQLPTILGEEARSDVAG